MLKLIKYELLKTKTILTIAFIAIICINLILISGLVFDIGALTGIGALLTALGFFGVPIGLLLYSAMLYTMDVGKKQGYMLFMTPNSTNKIFASKIITSVIVALVTLLLVLGMAALDFQAAIYATKDTADNFFSWGNLLETIEDLLSNNLTGILMYMATLILEWVCLICIIYFSITITYTFLSSLKFKGFFVFLIFIGLYSATAAINYIAQLITGNRMTELNAEMESLMSSPDPSLSDIISVAFDTKTFVIACIMYLIFITASYLGSSTIAKKKLSM